MNLKIERPNHFMKSEPPFRRPTLTIFGSCRQESLKTNYIVTNIRDELTYSHYTKEIIQAIEFCKGISNVSRKNTKYCFRTGLLTDSEINYRQFLDSFSKTDIFIAEIASRISYEWEGLYMHHIATEDEYKFYDRKNINIRTLTDDEIEKDIIKIRDLLYPKPLVIVSHITTYKVGKRYDLVKLLETICKKLNIPFINPSECITPDNYDKIFVKEDILSHYTEYGHSIILNVYNNVINSLIFK